MPDFNQHAAKLVENVTGMSPPKGIYRDLLGRIKDAKKNQAAVALGKLGGAKGGRARADKLSAAERSAIAQKAAKTRWSAKGAS